MKKDKDKINRIGYELGDMSKDLWIKRYGLRDMGKEICVKRYDS